MSDIDVGEIADQLLSAGDVRTGLMFGVGLWVVLRLVRGFYTVDQAERAVKTRFGRAERLPGTTSELDIAQSLNDEERLRYSYPQVRVIQPGGPYFRWPWEKVHKVSVATQITSIAFDPETPTANSSGSVLEAVTKDHLNTGLSGQLRFRVSEQNLYAYLFGVKNPIVHVMGYFISVLRERIACFEARRASLPVPGEALAAGASVNPAQGVSINDLRKNIRDINDRMEQESRSSSARYGVSLDACLITQIDPPHEVESALAAINTAYNHVSSEISLAQAAADQKIVQSKRVVEIQTLDAQAEVAPLEALAAQLDELSKGGDRNTLDAYIRRVRMALLGKASEVVAEVKEANR